jgi:hypothetical protein
LSITRVVLLLAASATLAGCAGWDRRSYGSWLDTYGMPPPGSRQQVAEPQASQLRAQIAELQSEAEAVRIKMAGEPDRVKRYAYLKQLRDIGDKQRPLDKLLHLGPKDPGLLPGFDRENSGA